MNVFDGLNIIFTDSSQTAGALFDQNGQDIASSQGGYRTVDLSAEAGKTISRFQLSMNNQGSLGGGFMYMVYGDIVLYSRDGTVRPVYTDETSVSLSGSGTSGITGVAYAAGHINNSWNPPIVSFPELTTVYYHGDQIGSARLLTDGLGNPIWSGVFLPFGQEQNPQITVNHYKFDGHERDAESGLDDFDARYYSSSIGRFMSADWSAIPAPVPYANLANPQTLNLYAMVSDNPETFADLDGHIGTGSVDPASGVNDSCGGHSCPPPPEDLGCLEHSHK